MKALVIIILSITALIFSYLYFTVEVIVRGTVTEHHAFGDRSGDTHYKTIARFEDGKIREIDGFSNYVVPIGGNVYIKYRKIK